MILEKLYLDLLRNTTHKKEINEELSPRPFLGSLSNSYLESLNLMNSIRKFYDIDKYL